MSFGRHPPSRHHPPWRHHHHHLRCPSTPTGTAIGVGGRFCSDSEQHFRAAPAMLWNAPRWPSSPAVCLCSPFGVGGEFVGPGQAMRLSLGCSGCG